MKWIVIGPCKCGGYGQVLDAEAEKETGKCHLPIERPKSVPPPARFTRRSIRR